MSAAPFLGKCGEENYLAVAALHEGFLDSSSSAEVSVDLERRVRIEHIRVGMNRLIVKRIIATEGQTVDFDFQRGIVYVDGEVYNESYISGLTHLDEGAFTDRYPITVPKGYVFVMGDNRRNSLDSRSKELGYVSVDNIEGKVLWRIYPADKLGSIK